MPTDLILSDDIDLRLGWPPGRAERLARKGRLPHYVLPDGAIRLRWGDIESLVRFVPAARKPVDGGTVSDAP